MTGAHAYRTYWARKALLAKGAPAFPLRRWWPTDGLSEIEAEYLAAVRDADALLDVGAGDLRLMRKFQTAGYRGAYHTQDIGTEYDYTYRSLDDVDQRYGAILCLDVIEHLALEEGLGLLVRCLELLQPRGALIVQTPNAWCIRDPRAWDMTHVHVYNAPDLWAFLTVEGCDTHGFRVRLMEQREGILSRLRFLAGAFVTTRLLGMDYADNIALVARKRVA